MPTIVSAGAGRIVTLSDLVGDPIHESGFDTAIKDTPVTVLSTTVAAGKKRNLVQCLLSCSIKGKMEIKLNGSVIGTARTTSGNLNLKFNWSPVLPITAGDTIAVVFTAKSSPSADIEAFLMSAQTDL